MKATSRILDLHGRPIEKGRVHAVLNNKRTIESRYDAAQISAETRKQWAMVDGMSAKEANSSEIRYRLRTRSRYECSNNSYAAGIVSTLANDTIGTGPRLQMLIEDKELASAIEKAFMRWSAAAHLGEKLWTMRRALAVDGEAFALLTTNDRIQDPVQLDLKLIEADQISTPSLDPLDANAVDGIRFDRMGNPVSYDLLKSHPGDAVQLAYDADSIDASRVLHWFRCERPGQARGIPEITPALPLFAQLRRYTLAVIAAAETAADFAAVVFSEMPPETGISDLEPLDTLEIERRMMTTLPAGWKMGQFKAEQPATTYKEFKAEILNEIARCLNMPFNVAAGNSSNYNYSSGRLDHQVYYRSIYIDQARIESTILDRVFTAWIDEASLTDDLIDIGTRLEGLPHIWFWDGFDYVDPEKEARAQETRLKNNTTTLAYEFARQGLDWEAQLQQRSRELALMRELDIPISTGSPSPFGASGDD